MSKHNQTNDPIELDNHCRAHNSTQRTQDIKMYRFIDAQSGTKASCKISTNQYKSANINTKMCTSEHN